MGFLVSPGVEVNEIDLTNVIPAVSTSIGGFVGEFRWGPAAEAITVSSEKELLSYYGNPDVNNAQSFLTAASFLKYGNTLKVSRAISPTASNASFNGTLTGDLNTTPVIRNNADFLASSGTLATKHIWLARYPGTVANGLTIYYAFGGASISSVVSSALNTAKTGTSNWSSVFSLTDSQDPTDSQDSQDSQRYERKDEIHIVVVDTLGRFTGTQGSILEVWEGLSVYSDAKTPNGSSAYYVDVINANSSYIYVTTAAITPTFAGGMTREQSYRKNLSGVKTLKPGSGFAILGSATGDADDGTEPALNAADYVTASAVFEDPELIDVNLLFTSLSGDAVNAIENELIRIAIARKDCVAFISAPLSVSEATSDANRRTKVTTKFSSATSTSYAVFDSTPLYVYNKYTDTYVYIPACGHMAGLCANTDNVAEPWFSPAGYNRGNLLGVTKLAYNPNQVDRDTLYKARINPIVSFPGQGIVLFGDKTAQSKPSAFDRINVRRLFITLEKAVATAAKYQLFELNDEFTRAMFRNMVEPFLREVKGRRGITDFIVICDETNNTGEVIDTNRFVADIYIKPARSINFITLNFIATRTGVEFSEIVGK